MCISVDDYLGGRGGGGMGGATEKVAVATCEEGGNEVQGLKVYLEYDCSNYWQEQTASWMGGMDEDLTQEEKKRAVCSI